MKNKRLIAILSVFLVLTILIVLCSTVFTLHTVDIVWLTNTPNLNDVSKTQIVSASELKMGESVFLLNKKKYTTNLEKNLPYVKVVGMEIKFPDKLTVKLSEREELYVLKVVDSTNSNKFNYVYLDYELKVLKISTTQVAANGVNPAVLEVENYNLTDANFTLGEKANLKIGGALIAVGNMLATTGYGGSKANALIESMVFNYGFKSEINIKTTYGLNIKIEDALIKTDAKMLKALSVYEEYHNNHPEINSGVITAYESGGVIVASAPDFN